MNSPDRTAYQAGLMTELLSITVPSGIAADPNRVLFATIIAGQSAGLGCLPPTLGLVPQDHQQLTGEYFPGYTRSSPHQAEVAIPEKEDLSTLLLSYRANVHHAEQWAATILASACAGRDHLWQDLGFQKRDQLSQFMWLNFPGLARENTGDMKWKKFIYRQLCAREGIYVCPAPSCGECKDFALCFGPEN